MSSQDWNQAHLQPVCDAIWDLEEELNLFDWQIGGHYVWPLLRMPFYYNITQQLGFFDNPHPGKNSHQESFDVAAATRALWDRIGEDRKFRRGNRAKLFRWKSQPGRYVVVPHGRLTAGTEIYTDAVRQQIGRHGLVIERAPRAGFEGLDLASVKQILGYQMRKLDVPEFKDDVVLDAIAQGIHTKLNVDVRPFLDTVPQRFELFVRRSFVYETMFKRAGTEKLFFTDSYYSVALAAGARRAGVRLIELQHGFISRFHLGYSFPRGQSHPYLADELWTFGQYWNDETPFSPATSLRIIGAPYVAELAAQHATERVAQRVVFTSQGAIGAALLPVAIEAARQLPDYEIFFRLHPSENLEDVQGTVDGLGATPTNFTINARTPNIFALLASADIQVGVFSTTLLEGMALGCRTAIVALPGSEYMSLVVERGDASIAYSPDQVVAAIQNAPYAQSAEYYYAKPESKLI